MFPEHKTLAANHKQPHARVRRQFSVRTLLLWTAVAGIYFGILRMLELSAAGFAFAACWVAAVVVVRGICDSKVAALLSALTGELAGGFLFCLRVQGAETKHLEGFFAFLLFLTLGCAFGYTLSVLVGAVASAIRRTEFSTGSHRRQRRAAPETQNQEPTAGWPTTFAISIRWLTPAFVNRANRHPVK